jgi:hypothetical protein
MTDTDENLATLDERIGVIEGRIRAIEALMLEMPGMTQELIETAKKRIRDDAKGGSRAHRDAAAILERLGSPLDEHAEAALGSLASALRRES